MFNSIPHLIFSNFKKFKNRKIIFDDNESITYDKFTENSLKFGNFLKTKKFKKKDRIGIYMKKNIDQATAIVGCLMGEYIFIPILPKLNFDSIKHVIKNSSMKAIITDDTKISELKGFEKITKIINYKKISNYINSNNFQNLKKKKNKNQKIRCCLYHLFIWINW